MIILDRNILPVYGKLYTVVVFDDYFFNYRYHTQRNDKHKNSNFSLLRT